MTLDDALSVLNIVLYPATMVIVSIALLVHLRRGNYHLVQRTVLGLPMFLAYWAWFRTWAPWALHSSIYIIVFLLVTLSSLIYILVLTKLYPKPEHSRKDS